MTGRVESRCRHRERKLAMVAGLALLTFGLCIPWELGARNVWAAVPSRRVRERRFSGRNKSTVVQRYCLYVAEDSTYPLPSVKHPVQFCLSVEDS